MRIYYMTSMYYFHYQGNLWNIVIFKSMRQLLKKNIEF